MVFGLAAAVLIIFVFGVMVVWGRSAAGQAWFERVYGAPETGRARRGNARRRATRSRSASSASSRKQGARRGRSR